MLKPLASLALCLAGACAQAVPSVLLNPDGDTGNAESNHLPRHGFRRPAASIRSC